MVAAGAVRMGAAPAHLSHVRFVKIH